MLFSHNCSIILTCVVVRLYKCDISKTLRCPLPIAFVDSVPSLVWRMKFPIFFLLVLCSTHTAAYGISGAYERMLYWYAYELDQQADGPKVVAKGCAGEFAVKTCNLKHFLTYIAEGPREKANARSLPDTINAHNIKADTAAEIIHRGHLTGAYRINYVYEMVNQIPDLFTMIARYASY